MGPSSKRRPRRQHVKYRMKVLKELGMMPLPDELIEKCMDEAHTTETQVDNIFLGWVCEGHYRDEFKDD